MIAMSKEERIMNEYYTSDWDIQADYLLDYDVFDKVARFHQSTTFTYKKNQIPKGVRQDLYTWLLENERKLSLPKNYISKVKLNDFKLEQRNSPLNFDNQYIIPFKLLSEILHRSFGADKKSKSRSFPSAGALYPIIVLVLVFDKSKIDGIVDNGVYFYNVYENSLLQIQKWEKNDMEKIANAFYLNEGFPSPIAIGYSIDMRKSLLKYRTKGYRHALIEIGLMAQRLREVLISITNNTFGERCWSGFSDNSLTYYSGLNVRHSPITLVQWFGKRMENHDI